MKEDAARPRVDTVRGELLWGKRPSYDFIADQRMGERRSLPRACPVLDTGVNTSLGEAARREAASLLATADRRVSKLRPGCVTAMPRA